MKKPRILLISYGEPNGFLAFNRLQDAGFSIMTVSDDSILRMIKAPEMSEYDLIVVEYDHDANKNGHTVMANIRELVGPDVSEFLVIVCYTTLSKVTETDKTNMSKDSTSIVLLSDPPDFAVLVHAVKDILASK